MSFLKSLFSWATPSSSSTPPPQPQQPEGGVLRAESISGSRGKLLSDVPYTNFSVTKDEGIVVVREHPQAHSTDEQDPELQMLQRLPSVMPILKNVPNFNWADLFSATGGKRVSLDSVDPNPLLVFAQRYQRHLKSCTKSVTHDQKLLATNIKQLDTFATKIATTMTQKSAQAQHFAEQLRTIPQLTAMLEQTNRALVKALQSVRFLNEMLPVEDRLEPIVIHLPLSAEMRQRAMSLSVVREERTLQPTQQEPKQENAPAGQVQQEIKQEVTQEAAPPQSAQEVASTPDDAAAAPEPPSTSEPGVTVETTQAVAQESPQAATAPVAAAEEPATPATEEPAAIEEDSASSSSRAPAGFRAELIAPAEEEAVSPVLHASQTSKRKKKKKVAEIR